MRHGDDAIDVHGDHGLLLMRAALLALLLCACGDTGGGGGPIPLDQLQVAYKAYYCNLYVRCGLVDDLITCSKAGQNDFADADLIAAAEAGTVVYDGAAAAECLAGLTASCDRTLQNFTPDACDRVFGGTVGDLGTCAINRECLSNSCAVTPCSTTCCEGGCQGSSPPVRPTLGQSCLTNPNCVDSYCDLNTNTCSAYIPAGASCPFGGSCARGLECSNGTCMQLPATGAPCTQLYDCSSIGDYCGASATCTPYGLTGSACTSDVMCAPWYRCDTTTSECALRPVAGDSCDNASCIDASYCDATTQKCVALLPAGAGCTSIEQCQSMQCGDSTTPNVCIAPTYCY